MTGLYPGSLIDSRGMPLFVLDNLRSAFNVGSVFRTAEAISPAGIILTGICCRPENRKLAHTSRGTHAHVPWLYFPDVKTALDWVRASGRSITAVTNAPEAVPVFEADIDIWGAFVLGNEALGLSPVVERFATSMTRFPQSGRRRSINVSSMAAVVAAEIVRRRSLRLEDGIK